MKKRENLEAYFDPFCVLGLEPGAGEDEIRKRYLELVKKHPPDREPEKFKEIQRAYDSVKDATSRLSAMLFEPGALPDRATIEKMFFEGDRRSRIPLLELLRSCRSR